MCPEVLLRSKFWDGQSEKSVTHLFFQLMCLSLYLCSLLGLLGKAVLRNDVKLLGYTRDERKRRKLNHFLGSV